jgi:hypothetical protein
MPLVGARVVGEVLAADLVVQRRSLVDRADHGVDDERQRGRLDERRWHRKADHAVGAGRRQGQPPAARVDGDGLRVGDVATFVVERQATAVGVRRQLGRRVDREGELAARRQLVKAEGLFEAVRCDFVTLVEGPAFEGDAVAIALRIDHRHGERLAGQPHLVEVQFERQVGRQVRTEERREAHA